jgi:hypothetical protein
MVVAGEEVTLVISKEGKDFMYFLQLQTLCDDDDDELCTLCSHEH